MELLFLLTCRWNFFLLIQVLYLFWLLFDCTVVPTLDHHLQLLLNPFLHLHIPIFSIKKIFRTCIIISHVHDVTSSHQRWYSAGGAGGGDISSLITPHGEKKRNLRKQFKAGLRRPRPSASAEIPCASAAVQRQTSSLASSSNVVCIVGANLRLRVIQNYRLHKN